MATPVIFFLVLSTLVLVHEFGHFIAARIFGIRVDEFALGLPFTRAIFKLKKGETQYSVYPLLFGGFVRLHGEESEQKIETERSFWNRGKKQRLLVLAAGVVMNVVLAVAGFWLLYTVIGLPRQVVSQVAITQVEAGSPAADAGFKLDDKVLAVEDRPVATTKEFSELVKSWAGLPVNVTVERGHSTPLFEGIWLADSKTVVLSVVPRVDPPKGQGALGVGIADYPYLLTQKCPTTSIRCQLSVIGQGFKTTGMWGVKVIDGFRVIGQSLSQGKAPEGVSGPVGIYQLTDVVSKGGFWPILELTAILSINLAIFNVLPIPALDGGRIFFILIEAIRRKRTSPETEQRVNSIGMAILLGLIALITLQDLIHLDFFRKLFKL